MKYGFKRIAERSGDASFGKGASLSTISATEKSLGVRFPASYRAFLREVGWFEHALLTVYGVGDDVPRHLDLVKQARFEIRAWKKIHPMPDGLLPICPDGSGGHHCLDTATSTEGEAAVIYWDHEIIALGHQPQRAAKSFSNFFARNAPRRERKPPANISLDQAIAQICRQAKRAGMGWERGATQREIASAERTLGVQFPKPVGLLLRQADGFEHAGGFFHYGVGHGCAPEFSLIVHAKRLWRKYPVRKNLLPIAQSWCEQLCCVDLSSDPLVVIPLDLKRLIRTRGVEPLPFETWAYRMGTKQLDPWNPV